MEAVNGWPLKFVSTKKSFSTSTKIADHMAAVGNRMLDWSLSATFIYIFNFSVQLTVEKIVNDGIRTADLRYQVITC